MSTRVFPDLGADEIHLGVVCGCYADHSFSHNRAGFLNPFVVNEQATRFFIAPEIVGGNPTANVFKLRFRVNERIPQNPPDNAGGWTIPHGSQFPPTASSGSRPDYDQIYTKTNSNSVPLSPPYIATVPSSISWPNYQCAPFMTVPRFAVMQLPADDEGAGFTSWVNLQAYLRRDVPSLVLFGDLQPEYR